MKFFAGLFEVCCWLGAGALFIQGTPASILGGFILICASTLFVPRRH